MSNVQYAVLGIVLILIAFPLWGLKWKISGGFFPSMTVSYGRLLAIASAVGGAVMILNHIS